MPLVHVICLPHVVSAPRLRQSCRNLRPVPLGKASSHDHLGPVLLGATLVPYSSG